MAGRIVRVLHRLLGPGAALVRHAKYASVALLDGGAVVGGAARPRPSRRACLLATTVWTVVTGRRSPGQVWRVGFRGKGGFTGRPLEHPLSTLSLLYPFGLISQFGRK